MSSAQLQALQAQLQGETYYLQVVGEAGRGGKVSELQLSEFVLFLWRGVKPSIFFFLKGFV